MYKESSVTFGTGRVYIIKGTQANLRKLGSVPQLSSSRSSSQSIKATLLNDQIIVWNITPLFAYRRLPFYFSSLCVSRIRVILYDTKACFSLPDSLTQGRSSSILKIKLITILAVRLTQKIVNFWKVWNTMVFKIFTKKQTIIFFL